MGCGEQREISKVSGRRPFGRLHQTLRDADIQTHNGKLRRLMASAEEADAFMANVSAGSGLKAVGLDANRALVTNPELAQYSVIHFATPGILKGRHPELSGIVLSMVDKDGREQDGYLRLHEIYNLRLPVNLVVLSACNTAMDKDVKGERLIGLTRGFMYAAQRH